MDPEERAFDIMEDPMFILNEASLEEAFLALQEHEATGLPVVNKHYRVTHYLTLTELLMEYFGDEQKQREHASVDAEVKEDVGDDVSEEELDEEENGEEGETG